jgi:DNA-binding NarL/FixJ family response regulator
MTSGPLAARHRLRILVADDHPAITRGIELLIEDQRDMVLVGVAHDAVAALDLPPCDVAVLDYHLGGRSGLWLTSRLKQRSQAPAVLLYSAFSDDVLTVAAALAGADGVLRKSAVADELCVAIRRLGSGGRYLPRVPPSVLRAVAADVEARDRAAFQLLAEGRRVADVAEHLGVGSDQVAAVREAALRRLSPPATRAHAPTGPRRALRRAAELSAA